jgi:hypothetical protein
VSNLDLNNLPPDLQATLSKKETDGERRVRLVKDILVFGFAMIVLIIAFIWSTSTLFDGAASPDNKHTAQTVVIAIVSGLLGYLLKK